MTSRLLTPPTTLAISLEDAKASLRIDPTGDVDADAATDMLVTAWIAGITAHAENYLGRAIIEQTWRVALDAFPDAIKLPAPPVISVTSVKYLDENGVQQTLDPADYLLDAESEPGWLVPEYGFRWPTTYDQVNAVTVDVLCGYGDDDTSVPPQIRLYLLAKLREQYDPAVRPEKETVQASFIDRLLDQYRVFGY